MKGFDRPKYAAGGADANAFEREDTFQHFPRLRMVINDENERIHHLSSLQATGSVSPAQRYS